MCWLSISVWGNFNTFDNELGCVISNHMDAPGFGNVKWGVMCESALNAWLDM